MLSASEIQDLEKKVFNYRMKKNTKFFVNVSLGLIFIGAIVGYFSYPETVQSLFSHTSKKPLEINANASIATISNNIIAVTKEVNATEMPIPFVEEIKEETLILRSPMVITENSKNIQRNDLKKELPFPKEENHTTQKAPSSFEEITFYRNAEEKIDTSVLAPPLLEEIKPKGIIKIETQEVNSIKYLKEKFEKTNNIIFALMLAEEYYLTKDYIQSNKWALIANHMDADNEKSWLWFAKSKVKLGQQEDAIVALKAYLKNSKSKAAQTLLNQIHLGELND